MFSTPLICSSNGVATVSATVVGLAPGNCAVTCTEGGTTSGYSETGSCGIAIRPARKMTAEMTPAKIGRSMKKRDKDIQHFPGRRGEIALGSVTCGLAALPLGHERIARRESLQMIEDYAVARLQTGKHDAIALDLGAERDVAILGLIAVTDDKNEA